MSEQVMDRSNPAIVVNTLLVGGPRQEITVSDVTLAFVEYNNSVSEEAISYVAKNPLEKLQMKWSNAWQSLARSIMKQDFYTDAISWKRERINDTDSVKVGVLKTHNLHKFRRLFFEVHGNKHVNIAYNNTIIKVDTQHFDGIIMSRIGRELEFRGESLKGKTIPTDVGFSFRRQ